MLDIRVHIQGTEADQRTLFGFCGIAGGIHAVGEKLDLDSFGRFAFAVATLLSEK